MNNNNRNNRRRGRGNRQQGGGGNQNRIDSRARGNAPQLLDKYKKLAQDAAHNGDRVQAEYYLQFADHYFRVIADNKSRQDEQRGKRYDERDAGNDDDDGDEDDFDSHRHQQPRGGNRHERGRSRADDGDESAAEGEQGTEGSEYEPAENPFTRGARQRTGDETGAASGNRRGRGRRNRPEADENDGTSGQFDAAALPPSISAEEDGGQKPARRPARRRKVSGDEASGAEGEAIKAVG
ncbi:MAG: DUF4167 domain-containing protein [Tsuneonella sp.]